MGIRKVPAPPEIIIIKIIKIKIKIIIIIIMIIIIVIIICIIPVSLDQNSSQECAGLDEGQPI